ncbi:lipoprotein [Xenorhabdus vietnamensis]|uniref:Lipoprotein n=1 Tax=Xenorhabdus vietnamensis TaxID=351656 RepID=A0A1Y2SG44_9GAMM|nr:hypothetical protein [Xenorhabdus vietnamensis]OTA17322.1 lipoprotein [Xenorhabdus vietnamensis]
MRSSSRVIVLASLPFFLTACDFLDSDDRIGQFYFTNSAELPLEFKIDDRTFSVKRNEVGMVDLKPGKHILETTKGKKQSFFVYPQNKGGIINPNRELYYAYNMMYVVGDYENKHIPRGKEVVIDGMIFEGGIRSSDSVFIDNNAFHCSYQLGMPLPDEITIRDEKMKQAVRTKCFSKQEFIGFYEKESGEKFSSPNDPDSLYSNENTVTDQFYYQIPTANFSDPILQKDATELVSLIKDYIRSDSVTEQEELRKKHTDIIMHRLNRDDSNFDVKERVKFEKLCNQVNDIIAAGIIAK